ncbi:hypothetical protein QYF36_017750 [Acer negundo]|nr:hypothetical protein QYF36_017750 [Acer negundo]
MLHLKERCVEDVPKKSLKISTCCPPANNVLLFNVDDSARGNPGDASIGGVLRDSCGKEFRGIFLVSIRGLPGKAKKDEKINNTQLPNLAPQIDELNSFETLVSH